MKAHSMNIISIKISDDIQRRLEVIEKKRRTSKSAIVREALQSYLSPERDARPGSCLALARDLAGCCFGPADLASDPKHMKDYGK
jgi:hypothetical protein